MIPVVIWKKERIVAMTLEDLRASTASVLNIEQTRDVLADVGGERPDPRTVRRACERGQLPAIYVGKRIFVIRERLLAMLTAEAAASSTPPAA